MLSVDVAVGKGAEYWVTVLRGDLENVTEFLKEVVIVEETNKKLAEEWKATGEDCI